MRSEKNKRISSIPLSNVVKEGVTITQIDYLLRIVIDGKINDFPQYLTDIVNKSPVSSACVKRISDFVIGGGLHDDIKDIVIDDKGKTFADLHNAVAEDYAFSDRLAVRVNFKGGGKISSLSHVPFEWVRFAANDDYDNPNFDYVKVNPFLSTTQETWTSEQIKTYRLYESSDPNEIRRQSKEREGYYGHMLFYNDTRAGARVYSRPRWFAAERTIITDGRIWAFHDRNTANNFFIGGVLGMYGDPDLGIGEMKEDGTYNKYFRDVINDELEKTFSGVENAGSIMVVYMQNAGDEFPKIEPWPKSQTDNMFTNLLNDTVNTITAAFGVPKVLLPQEISGKLGTSQEIRNAILFMNETTQQKRDVLEAKYKLLLDGMGVKYPENEKLIKPLKDFTDLPDVIYKSLSQAQRNEYLQENFGILPDEENPEEVERSPQETILSGLDPNILQNGNGNN